MAKKKRAQARKESAEERFWRRERLTEKYKNVEKRSRAERAGKMRPAKSRSYLLEIEERFRLRLAKRISEKYHHAKYLQARAEMAKAKAEEMATNPERSFQNVVKHFIEADRLELKMNEAEGKYLALLLQEMVKGNVTWREGVEKAVDDVVNGERELKRDLETLQGILKDVRKNVLDDHRVLRKMLKADKKYIALYNTAKETRKNFRRVKKDTEFKAIIDLVLLDLKLAKPEEVNKNEMLRAVYVTQKRINYLWADIALLDRYTGFLARFGERFDSLRRTVRSTRKRKKDELATYKKVMRKYEHYWYGKKRKKTK